MTQYLVSDAAKICGTSSLHTVPVPQCLLAKTASRPRSRRLPVPYADETNFEKCSEFFFVFFQKLSMLFFFLNLLDNEWRVCSLLRRKKVEGDSGVHSIGRCSCLAVGSCSK